MADSLSSHGSLGVRSFGKRKPISNWLSLALFVALLLVIAGVSIAIPQAGEQTLLFLQGHPGIALTTLLAGALFLYVECLYPGLVLPGSTGAAGVLLGILALSHLPLHGVGIGLFVLALGLFAIEAWRPLGVRGLWGLAATAALTAGVLQLMGDSRPAMQASVQTAIVGSVIFGLTTTVLLSLAARARCNKKTSVFAEAEAIALEEINPSGRVRLDGEVWEAESKEPIPPGTSVRVLRIRGLRLEVEPLAMGKVGGTTATVERT